MTTAPSNTPTIKTTTGDMLPKNAVLDDAMSVEIVVGNEGILRKIRGHLSCLASLFWEKLNDLSQDKERDTYTD